MRDLLLILTLCSSAISVAADIGNNSVSFRVLKSQALESHIVIEQAKTLHLAKWPLEKIAEPEILADLSDLDRIVGELRLFIPLSRVKELSLSIDPKDFRILGDLYLQEITKSNRRYSILAEDNNGILVLARNLDQAIDQEERSNIFERSPYLFTSEQLDPLFAINEQKGALPHTIDFPSSNDSSPRSITFLKKIASGSNGVVFLAEIESRSGERQDYVIKFPANEYLAKRELLVSRNTSGNFTLSHLAAFLGTKSAGTDYINGAKHTVTALISPVLEPSRTLTAHQFRQLLLGVQDLHRRYIHRDLKPDNIMIRGAASISPGTVVIIDFGLAKKRDPKDDFYSFSEEGSLVYSKGHTKENGTGDIRSLGIIGMEAFHSWQVDFHSAVWQHGLEADTPIFREINYRIFGNHHHVHTTQKLDKIFGITDKTFTYPRYLSASTALAYSKELWIAIQNDKKGHGASSATAVKQAKGLSELEGAAIRYEEGSEEDLSQYLEKVEATSFYKKWQKELGQSDVQGLDRRLRAVAEYSFREAIDYFNNMISSKKNLLFVSIVDELAKKVLGKSSERRDQILYLMLKDEGNSLDRFMNMDAVVAAWDAE